MNTKQARGALNSPFLITAGLFLFSGLSSLIYQVIWTRLLVFVFGSTTFATSTVLSVFMGGLALGSYLAGRKADSIKNPLLAYGILELIIGLWALIIPLLFAASLPIYKACFESLHLQVIAFGILRYVIASVILLLPTACMGATLPLLSKFVTESLEQVGDRVGTLYGINTLGAVVGSMLGGFVLIPNYGLSVTTFIAAAINGFLMLAVLGISKLPAFAARNEIIAVQVAELKEETKEKLPAVVKATMLSFGISGALAMIYEVAWTRALLMVVGSTTYAFTVMLSAFLVGIFGGSLICARFVDKLKSPVLAFAVAELFLCLFGIAALFTFNQLPFLNLLAGVQFKTNPEMTLLCRFLAAGMVLLPISLCLGMVFPLAVKVCARDLQKIGHSLGQLYSINTVGAIIGAFLAGFVVIPIFGTEQTLVLTSMVNLLLGAIILAMFSDLKPIIKNVTVFASICSFLYILANPPQIFDVTAIVGAQTFRRHVMISPTVTVDNAMATYKALLSEWSLEFYKEGKSANVAILKNITGIHSLITNGHIDASDSADMCNQALLAALPLLTKKTDDQNDVCVVGWGSGVTTGYALRFPIKEMVCSELEPIVIETSPFFHKVNFKPEEDKRSIVEPSDGRNYLLGTSRKFDEIISEPSNPWQAGVCNLFTKEYFQICKEGLKPGGVFTMWSQVSEIPTKDLKHVFSALHSAFPYIFIFDSGNGYDTITLAFDKSSKLNFAQIKANLEIPAVKNSLAPFHLQTAEDCIARILVCPEKIANEVNGVQPNSDERNFLEYDIAKTYENKSFNFNNRDWLSSMNGPVWNYIDWSGLSDSEKSAEFLKIAKACVSYSGIARSQRAVAWAEESMRILANADALAFIADLRISDKQYAEAAKIIQKGKELFPADSRFLGLEGVAAINSCDYARASQLFEQALKLKSDNFNFRFYLALCYSNLHLHDADGLYVPPKNVDPSKVIQLCSELSNDAAFIKNKPQALALLADAYLQTGKVQESQACLQKLLASSPRYYLAWRLLGRSYDLQKDWKKALIAYTKSQQLANDEVNSRLSSVGVYLQRNRPKLALRELQAVLELNPLNPSALAVLRDLAKADPEARALLQMENSAAVDSPKT